MTSFFNNALGGIGANPFSTQIGSRIENATDGSLATENWALNIEICDLINETEDGPRDAVKAIRKRLSQNIGKNYTVIMYTLIILETCVKNCGKRFHELVCNKDFANELVKLIAPKNEPPAVVQLKVLSLIQSWADAFRHEPNLYGIVSVYQDLVAKGIEFPTADFDTMAPIHTPQRTVNVDVGVESNINAEDVLKPTILSTEQRAKLQSEIDVVQSNMNVLGEMLNEVIPGEEHHDELDLLLELYCTCQEMQKRLVELISHLANDESTAELLRVNDDLNNLFLRYHRWEKKRSSQVNIHVDVCENKISTSELISRSIPPHNQTSINLPSEEESLISFTESTTEQLAKMDKNPASICKQISNMKSVRDFERSTLASATDEFDMLAQSRNVNLENIQSKSHTYKENSSIDQVGSSLELMALSKNTGLKEHEIVEVRKWLEQTPSGPESLTSSEFDKFLTERAAAVENLPSASSEPKTTPKKVD